MEGMKRFPVVAGHSQATAKLIEFLRNTDKDVVTDAELASIAGESCAVRGRCYASLQTALRYIERNHGRAFKRVPNSGTISRLIGTDGASVAHVARSSIRKKATRTCCILGITLEDSMTQEERRAHLSLSAQFGTIAVCARPSTTRKLTKMDAVAPLKLDGILKLFRQPRRNVAQG